MSKMLLNSPTSIFNSKIYRGDTTGSPLKRGGAEGERRGGKGEGREVASWL